MKWVRGFLFVQVQFIIIQGSFFNFLYIFFANTSIILCPKVQLPLFRVSANIFPMRFAKLTLGGELRVRLSLGQVSSLARHFTFTLPLSTLENMNTSRTGSSPRKSERTDAWGRLRTLSYSSGAGRRQEGPKVFADPSPSINIQILQLRFVAKRKTKNLHSCYRETYSHTVSFVYCVTC